MRMSRRAGAQDTFFLPPFCVCGTRSPPSQASLTWGCVGTGSSSSRREIAQVPRVPCVLFVLKTLQQRSGPHPSFPAHLGFPFVGSQGGRRRGRDSEGGSLIEAEPASQCQALLPTWQWGSQNLALGYGWPPPPSLNPGCQEPQPDSCFLNL